LYNESSRIYFLLNNENDFLSKDNLNFFYWISSNSNKNNNLVFFNYFNTKLSDSKSFNSVFFNDNKHKNTNIILLNYWLNRSLFYSPILHLINFVEFF
jgi:hypothetical protein